MKRILYNLTILTVFFAMEKELQAQGITSPETYIRFVQLAIDGRYDIIKQELRSEKYIVSKDIQPYSLNGVTNLVDFVYEYPHNYYELKSFNLLPMVSINVKEYFAYEEHAIFFRFVSLCKVLSMNFDRFSSYYLSLYPDYFDFSSTPNMCLGLMQLKRKSAINKVQEFDISDFVLFQTEEVYDKGFGTLAMTVVYRKWKKFGFTESKSESNINSKSIKIINVGSSYKVPVLIGGRKYEYYIDSGATYFTISSTMEKQLIELGIIRESDYNGTVYLELADKSTQNYRKLILPIINVGDFKITNIETVVIEDGNLLLGKSVLDKFKGWRIDNLKSELILE